MDYSCRDIPMRLDIRHQPLNFDIYLSQVTEIPRTRSLEEEPYSFRVELGALEHVDKIIKRSTTTSAAINKQQQQPLAQPADHTPLTPIKSSFHSLQPTSSSELVAASSTSNGTSGAPTSATSNGQPAEPQASRTPMINPREFEDINNDPFDHLALQTIDELRELNLVFQASQNSTHQQQTPAP